MKPTHSQVESFAHALKELVREHFASDTRIAAVLLVPDDQTPSGGVMVRVGTMVDADHFAEVLESAAEKYRERGTGRRVSDS